MPRRPERLYAIRVVPRAARQIRAAVEWWLGNRPAAPEAIERELARVFRLIAARPGLGVPLAVGAGAAVRRLHLHRVGYHLYYRPVDAQRRVDVLAFWHSRRGIGPPL